MFVDGFEVSDQKRASDDLARNVGESPVVVAGVLPQGRERVVHTCLVPFREDSLRLFNDDAAVEGHLELLPDNLMSANSAFLDDADSGDVCKCLPDPQFV